jgi:acetyltransferase-like isoleucine patch superfamily enzyme
MALIGYRLDVARARVSAIWHRLLGLDVGSGARIHPGVLLRCKRGRGALGSDSTIYRDVQVLCTGEGRFRIGRDSHIAPQGYFLVGMSELVIGDQAAIGPFCGVFCESNGAAAGTPFCEQHERAPVHIGSNVFIGTKVTVLPGSHIEDNVVVAAHAVVRGRLASGWVYAGVPARPLRRVAAA